MGIKEDTYDEHWGLYVDDESLNSTPGTNTALYISDLKLKLKKEADSSQPPVAPQCCPTSPHRNATAC